MIDFIDGYLFWHLYGRTYLGQFSRINRNTESAFHLNNSVNVPLNLKENCIPEYAFS